MFEDRELRLHRVHKIVLWIAAVAFFVITLDGLVESGRLASFFGEKTRIAKMLGIWASNHESGSELAAQYVMIPIDHGNLSEGSYVNRYWVNDKYYVPGGPVFVYDSGEGDASGAVKRFLQRPTSFQGELLQEFHGLGIVWEHRYYGESLPYPVNESTPAHDLRFLTLNQSLADLPYFAGSFHLHSWPEVDLTPKSTPWVMMGCSYSGTRSALSRLVHPETFFAAYAGSPVVEFSPGLDDFFESAYRNLVDHGYENCTRHLHMVIEYVDGQLDDPQSSARIKQQFFGPGAELNDNKDFANALSSMYNYHKSWGIYQGKPALTDVCDYLAQDLIADEPILEQGLTVSQSKAQLLAARLASFEPLLNNVNLIFETNCSKSGQSGSKNCNFATGTANASAIAWNYQQCSELGYLVHQKPSSHHLASKYMSLIHQVPLCQRFFPTSPELLLPELEQRVKTANHQFGGWKMRPSNVFWSTGQYDPYRKASPLAREMVDLGNVSVTQNIPECNVSTGPDTVFGEIIPEAGHCVVIAKNTSQALETRKTFAKALHKWLECF